MKKFKMFKTYSEEEKWLSEQADLGWELVKKRFFYNFQKKKPETLLYGVDYRTFKNKDDYQDYLRLFEDAGWRHVAGNLRSGDQYFYTNSQNERDISIFSDRISSQERYKKKRIHYLNKVMLISSYMVLGSLLNIFNFRIILNPRRAFLTPGIWEKSGEAFLKAFLFELPFALIFRLIPCVLLLGYIVILIVNVLWSINGFKKEEGLENEK